MAIDNIKNLKSYFETDDEPSAAQFIDVFDSMYAQNTGELQTATVSGSNAYKISAKTIGSAGDMARRVFSFVIPTTNSGATTLLVSPAASAKSVKKYNNQALVTGDWTANELVRVQYDASAAVFRTLTPVRTIVMTTAAVPTGSITSAKLASNSVSTSKIQNNAITSAKIASAAVSLGKLQNGTTGQLITWSSASQPTTVAVGTSGYVLTSNGTGNMPTWQVTAGLSASTGFVMEVYTAATSWARPSGVSKVKVTVVGGGGGSGSLGNGGASSFGSYITANGGLSGGNGGTGGTATGGDINIKGQSSDTTTKYGGNSMFGFGGTGLNLNATGYGAGGANTSGSAGGGAGGCGIKYITSVTASVSITVGSGATTGNDGTSGIVIVEYIK